MSTLSEKHTDLQDRRAMRSRAAIIGALNALLLDETAGGLSVGSVVDAAGVARSTFYEHFGSLDALICAAITPLFDELARTSLNVGDLDQLQRVLEHFWTKRRLANFLLTGRRADTMTKVLATSYSQAMMQQDRRGKLDHEHDKIAANFLAAGVIGVLREWLTGRLSVDTKAITSVLAKARQLSSDK